MIKQEALRIAPPPEKLSYDDISREKVDKYKNISYYSDVMNHYYERRAFTLAEVLITLGIIGVVAALTIPSLIAQQREQETVAKLKKHYQTLSNAYLMAVNENGPILNWGITADSTGLTLVANNLKKQLKINEDCGLTIDNNCAPGDKGQFKDLKGRVRTASFANETYYNFRQVDGTAVAIRVIDPVCTSNNDACFEYYVDLNGSREPNTLGKDIFYFRIYGNDKILPVGTGYSPKTPGWQSCNPKTGEGWYCTAWVIFKENMDYLHCASELDWNGKSSCK